jgi:hypothetical protein
MLALKWMIVAAMITCFPFPCNADTIFFKDGKKSKPVRPGKKAI